MSSFSKVLSNISKKASDAPAAVQNLLLHIFTPAELATCSVRGRSYKTKNGESFVQPGLPPLKLNVLYSKLLTSVY